MFRRSIFVMGFLSSIAGLSSSAFCETPQDVAWCERKGNPTPDQQIIGCTASIQSGKYANDKLAIAFNNRGLAYSYKKDYQKALADFNQAIRLNPNYANALNQRCWQLTVLAQPQAALADCTKSLGLKPNDADFYDTRGFAYLKMSDFVRAVADFNSALKLDPKMASSLYGRGLAKLKMGDMNGGNADIAAAKSIKLDVTDDVAEYGVQ
jgi:tetratricopeptide (TPR) repeat protein